MVDRREMKVIGRRTLGRRGLIDAAPFLDLVLKLRGDKPFMPRGLYRFETFEEADAWAIRMMARPSRRGQPD